MTGADAIAAAAALGLFYYLAQSPWLAGLGFWTLYRPLVAGAVSGWVLGDVAAGTQVGVVVGLAQMGFSGSGGALGHDPALVAYLASALALAAGLDARAALLAALPFGLLGSLAYGARLAVSAPWAERAMESAAVGDRRRLAFWHLLPPQAATLLLQGLPCALLVWAALRWGPLLHGVPAWLPNALRDGGGLLPALGVAGGLELVYRRGGPGAFLAGAVSAWALGAWGGWGVALAVAAGHGLFSGPREGRADAPAPGERLGWRAPDGRAWWVYQRWLFGSHASVNARSWLGAGLAFALAPVCTEGSRDRAERAPAATPFRLEPNLGAALVGTLARLQAEGVPPQRAEGLRASLAGPLSGAGERLIHAGLGPALLALALGVAWEFGAVGALLHVGFMATLIWTVSARAFALGYGRGAEGVLALLRSPSLARWREAARLAAAGLLGAAVVRCELVGAWLARMAGAAWSPLGEQAGLMGALAAVLFWAARRLGAPPICLLVAAIALGFVGGFLW